MKPLLKPLIAALAAIMLSVSQAASADVILMVHGYLGNSSSWEHSQVSQILDANELRHSGRFVAGPQGPQLLVPAGREQSDDAANRVYLGDLPSTMSTMVQADLLMNMLQQLQAKYPGEDITLIGHSAGGVVARLALVKYRPQSVKRLITIASPHVGTWRAQQALKITRNHGPFNIVKRALGGSEYDALRHSRGLLAELRTPRPGSMLFWLNAQPHPDIEYVSIVRLAPNGFAGDSIVPGYSQDMNNVPALVGKSAVIATRLPHSLTPMDAGLILELLRAGETS